MSMDRSPLSPARRALLERWSAGGRYATPTATISPRGAKSLEASFRQRSIWLVETLDRTTLANNQSFCLRLRGSMRADLLRASLQDLVDRHEILRTGFHGSGMRPILVVAANAHA